MSRQRPQKEQSLEQLHSQLVKTRAEPKPESESLEQPYAGEVVETVTTYSVYEEPMADE